VRGGGREKRQGGGAGFKSEELRALLVMVLVLVQVLVQVLLLLLRLVLLRKRHRQSASE
jgi:hypothetical protein